MTDKTIILSHIPLHPDSSDKFCLHWDWEDILNRVKRAKLCLSGHRHKGGFFQNEETAFVTVEGVI